MKKNESKNPKKKDDKDEELLRTARKRFEDSYDAEKENRDRYIDDTKFSTTADQWPDEVKQLRGPGRPALTINKLNAVLKQIIGDYRQNEIAIKVRPADSNADVEIAEIYDGLIRNIQDQSKANIAYTTAFECAARGGFGYFRVTTEYSNDDSFEQDIRIRRITNPLTVYFDPHAQELLRWDARYCFVTEKMPREDFEELYPDVNPTDFEGNEDTKLWYDDKSIRVAEYWVKEPYTKRIAQLSDNTVVDMDEDGVKEMLEMLANPAPTQDPQTGQEVPGQPITVVKEREVECEEVYFYKISGHAVLEKGKWAGKFIPIIPAIGEEVDIEGKKYSYSAIHHSKDAQRMYNYWKTTATEAIALAPKAPYLVTPEQIAGHESEWASANTATKAYLPYNMTQAEAPQRAIPPQPAAAEMSMAMGASDDIKATTGIYDASLGAQGNEKSGKAIMARQREGDNATYTFVDNMRRAIEHCGTILVDLIPRIYDTERVVRVLGIDASPDMVIINRSMMDPETGQEVIVNDLSQGKYDVVTSSGPSYATQRIESADSMMQFMQAVPQAGAAIADLVAKNMDWPGAEQIAKRLEKMLPPQLAGESDDPEEKAQQQMQQQQAMQQQQMHAQMVMQQQQQEHELAVAKEENMKMKTMAEQARTQVEMQKVMNDREEIEMKKHAMHIALTSGAMRQGPYFPESNQG